MKNYTKKKSKFIPQYTTLITDSLALMAATSLSGGVRYLRYSEQQEMLLKNNLIQKEQF